MPHIIGENIMLREYREEDLPAIRAWVNDEETTRYLSGTFRAAQSVANTQDFLQRMMQGNGAFASNFVIADRATQDYIGQVDFFQISWPTRCGTIGMVVGKKEMRGRGVGTEALKLLVRYGFLTLGLERAELDVHQDNARAIRCYENAGFRHEGRKRHAVFTDGRFRDLLQLSVLRDEWLADNPLPDVD